MESNTKKIKFKTYNIVRRDLRYSIKEIGDGVAYANGRIKVGRADRISGSNIKDETVVAAVIMYNPISFKDKSYIEDGEIFPVVDTPTLNTVCDIFNELLEQDKYVRIYNLTISSSLIRGELWGGWDNKNLKVLRKKKDELISAKDENLTDDEKKVKWWVAFNHGLGNSPANKESQASDEWIQVEMEFRSERWKFIMIGIENKTLLGVNVELVVFEDSSCNFPLDNNVFIHPYKISKIAKNDSPSYKNFSISLRSKLA